MKKLTLLLTALFVSATLYGGEMFNGNVSINMSGEVPEAMISMLESNSSLVIWKDFADYVTFPVTLTKGKNSWTYEDSSMKITYKPKTKKFTLKMKYPCVSLGATSEETSESASMKKGTVNCSGTFPEDISSSLEGGASIALSDFTSSYYLFNQTWKMSKKGKNLVLNEKSTEFSLSVNITPKKRTAKCTIKVSGHWMGPMLFHPN